MISEIRDLLERFSGILPVIGFVFIGFVGGYFLVDTIVMYMKSILLF